MKKQMTQTELKKKLGGLEKQELVQIVCELYKKFDNVEQNVNYKILGDEYSKKLLGQYQEQIYKIFFPKSMNAGFSLTKARSYIKEFKKVCDLLELQLELKLYFVECGVEFTNMYGDIDARFYDVVCSEYDDVIKGINQDEKLYLLWKDRIANIISETNGIGWGFHDYIVDVYCTIPWIEDEEDEE